jgi:hypothetical protein
LSRVPGADCPYSAAALLVRHQAHGVIRSANLEGTDWLQIFQLQINFGGAVIVEPNERRSDRCLINVGVSIIDQAGWDIAFVGVAEHKRALGEAGLFPQSRADAMERLV